MEKLIPQNIEAEQAVIGSILIDPDALPQVDYLRPSDFYRNSHRQIFTAILKIYERRETPDFLTLCDELETDNQLEDVGGAYYITTLVNAIPTSANIEYYARIVEQKAQLRRVIEAASKMAALAYAGDNDTVTRAEEMIYSLSQKRRVTRLTSLPDAVSRYITKLDKIHSERRRGVLSGVPTGFKALDQILGGFQPSDLITLAARPAVGKTSLALNIAEKTILESTREGYNVLMFSLEMGEEQLIRRMISMRSGIDQTRLRTADIEDDEWQSIVNAAGDLARGKMWIDDTAGIRLTEMRSRARRIKSEHGLDLILVDYMQLMKATTDGGREAENRVQEVSLISRGLKELARELDVPVLALAQLNRSVETRADKMPQLSDLKESGSIEQDSDVVMFIHQDPNAPKSERGYILNVLVAKHRNGPVGTVPLWFTPSLTRFSDVEDGFLRQN